MKKCYKCKQQLPNLSFSQSKGRISSCCKKCAVKKSQEWAIINKERLSQYRKKYYIQNKEKRNIYIKNWKIKNKERYKKIQTNSRYLKNYGISYDDKYKLIEQQGLKCAICKNIINMTTGCVDHNHTNKIIRGILCNDCNLGIGFLKDNLNILESALIYLKTNT